LEGSSLTKLGTSYLLFFFQFGLGSYWVLIGEFSLIPILGRLLNSFGRPSIIPFPFNPGIPGIFHSNY